MSDFLTDAVNDVLFPAIDDSTRVMKRVQVEMPASGSTYDPLTGQTTVTRETFNVRGAIVALGFKDRITLKGVSSSDFKFLLPAKGLAIVPTNGARLTVGGETYNVECLLSQGGGALLSFHVKRA